MPASLTPFFGALADLPLFVVFERRPKADGRPGTDKIPVNPHTLRPVDCHNPAERMTLAQAELWVSRLVPSAPVLDYGTGYVLTPEVKTFFIDLDHCREDGQWLDYVAPILAEFPGAYVEVSKSNDGLHILGSYAGDRPLHGTRCKELRAELYTAGRFCALGGQFPQGLVLTDHTAALHALVPRFSRPDPVSPRADEWTDGPVAGWRGPTDDDELIDLGKRVRSAGSVFGSGASFADLWDGTTERLVLAYPPQTGGSEYDASGADQALANRLMWLTGNDCERTARLLRQSGLSRPKHERDDYLRSTVLRAWRDDVYGGRVVPGPAAVDAVGVPPQTGPAQPDPATPPNPYLDERLDAGDFYAIMESGRFLYLPTGQEWAAKQVETRVGSGMADTITAYRPVEQLIWAPGEGQYLKGRLLRDGGWVEKAGANALNTYKPGVPLHGDAVLAQPWIDHVVRIYPESAHHIILWLAHRVQRPGEKINHALIFGGVEGIGKDTILEPVKRAVGPWNFQEIEMSALFGRFNGYVKSVVLRVNEAKGRDVDPFELYDRTKTLIAAPPDAIRVDQKNVSEYYVQNIVGVIFTTNRSIYFPPTDRRHYVARSSATPASLGGEDYFKALWAWFESGGFGHVAQYLAMIDLREFNPKAPPPRTEAWRTMVAEGTAPENADLDDALDALGRPAAITVERMIKQLPAAHTAQRIFADSKARGRVPHRLRECGYERVASERVDGLWQIDGKRQTVFGRADLSTVERVRAAGLL